MIRMTIIAAAILCSGCTALETRETKAWLVMHAVDTAQTYRIAQDACFEERPGLTRALIGRKPSDGEIAAWSVGMAALKIGVTDLLLRNEHPKLAKAWQYLNIGVTADAIGNNHSIGIRLGSPNQIPNVCREQPERTPSRPIG
jgi:hypothetical protein